MVRVVVQGGPIPVPFLWEDNMAYTLPNELSPSAAFDMLMKHALQREQSRRMEAQNQRAQEMQPFNIKHLMAQTQGLEGENTRANEMQPYTLQHLLAETQGLQGTNKRNEKLLPYRMAQLQAAAQQAQANAAWNNMLTGSGGMNPTNGGADGGMEGNTQNSMPQNNPMSSASNLQGQGPFSDEESQPQNSSSGIPSQSQLGQVTVVSPGNPKLSRLNDFAGIKGIPQVQTHYDENGNLITRYPNGMITMQKIGPSKAENAANEAFTKTDAKIVDQLQQQAVEGGELQQTYEDLGQVFSDPLWSQIHTGLLTKGGQKGRQYQLDLKRNFGTDEEKALIARADSGTSKVVSQMAKVFKGPFRIAEQSLIERVKPQSYDTPEASQSKLQLLNEGLEKQQYINQRIPDLIRKEGLSATDAFKKAYGEVKGDEFKNQLKQKFGGDKTSEAKMEEEAKALNLSMEDVNHTAQLKGITPQEVINRYKGAHHGA